MLAADWCGVGPDHCLEGGETCLAEEVRHQAFFTTDVRNTRKSAAIQAQHLELVETTFDIISAKLAQN